MEDEVVDHPSQLLLGYQFLPVRVHHQLQTLPLQLEDLRLHRLLYPDLLQFNLHSVLQMFIVGDASQGLPHWQGQQLQFVQTPVLQDPLLGCTGHEEADEDLDHAHAGDDDGLQHLSAFEDGETDVDIVQVVNIVAAESGLG